MNAKVDEKVVVKSCDLENSYIPSSSNAIFRHLNAIFHRGFVGYLQSG